MTFQGVSLLVFMVIFMRVFACFTMLPGFSAIQVPVRLRLFLAAAFSFSIFMMIGERMNIGNDLSFQRIAQLMLVEFVIAAMIAIPVRFLFLALSFLGEVTMQMIGLNPIPGTPIGDDQASSTLSSLFNITALVLFFSSGLHLALMMTLAHSFVVLPPGEILSYPDFLETLTNSLNGFFKIVVKLGAPLFIYAVVMNAAAGLVNKLTPQIPIYFVSTPFLIFGGMVILAWAGDDMLFQFLLELDRLIDRLL